MKPSQITAFLFMTALGAGSALAQSQMPAEDQPATIDGVETVCTGASLEARAMPEWRAYPMRIEFVGKGGQYLGDEQVTISGNGKSVSVHCAGPWVLMKLPNGTYKVSADVADAGHRDFSIRVPGRAVVRFPDAGGVLQPSGRIAAR